MTPDGPAGDRDDPLAGVARLPGVDAAVAAARSACEELRWHEAFRRRWREVRAEAGLRAAAASAALDGAPVGLDVLRAWATGDAPTGTATDRVARGALRAQAVVERLLPDLGARGGTPPPSRQVLARLHAAAAVGTVPAAELGRPRPGPPHDLRGLGPAPDPQEAAARVAAVLDDAAGTRAPGLVVVAVVHAELLAVRPFVAANGVVARAFARLLAVTTGLDPTGAVLPEGVWRTAPTAYQAGLARYAAGDVAGWVTGYAESVVAGAGAAREVADAVLAGRLGPPA